MKKRNQLQIFKHIGLVDSFTKLWKFSKDYLSATNTISLFFFRSLILSGLILLTPLFLLGQNQPTLSQHPDYLGLINPAALSIENYTKWSKGHTIGILARSQYQASPLDKKTLTGGVYWNTILNKK